MTYGNITFANEDSEDTGLDSCDDQAVEAPTHNEMLSEVSADDIQGNGRTDSDYIESEDFLSETCTETFDSLSLDGSW
ncbi:hypothetical protein C2845_PM02G23910 [Panicum miliaceum]|uniref:Uncharacterized protein n=1 Tax=Panicum miliaceum TaxID=4540 RepID=A0A3L6S820_PANMI|nr:hypothetical protein C2845_PM02G23910 [Panicum miliaceum]